ncbi:hypothetical protein [Endozoicomonas sp. SCSIO W0465]|uniref:hypothetical protein n=1 Tax=Endozoicomonas sp. SCSIO W0465 TaxID=2918516 RepID=UPI002074B396|nr:hypothetical protein [Endozoicomonas sp. SCSIO W0465]USE35613.1 hypothetical protein MJO57_26585 [Endozoicomonas sp. SCSIO W0465]
MRVYNQGLDSGYCLSCDGQHSFWLVGLVVKIKLIFLLYSRALAWAMGRCFCGCIALVITGQTVAGYQCLSGEVVTSDSDHAGTVELRDIYGVKGSLKYTAGCLLGAAESCQIMISAPSEAEEIDAMEDVEDDSLGYVNYLSYLKRTGQSLLVDFEEILTESASAVAGYKVLFTTESKIQRLVKRIDSRTMPATLQKNPLLIFLILATHQSALDLMLSPERNLYIISLEWLNLQPLYISGAGRGGLYGYRYYHFPKDNELFLDLGGPFSINSLSEGVGFSFADNDRTQPPMRMVTGYHGDQNNGFVNRISLVVTYVAVAGGYGVSLWSRSIVGFLVSSLLLAAEIRTRAASSELEVLARRVFPEGLQFNQDFQGRRILKVLRASDRDLAVLH